jgi:hypothetical protein
MSYKEQLLRGLNERGWEQTAIEDGAGWWADEHWRIRSVRENWGDELILTFLVDPQSEGPRKKGHDIWQIAATPDMPPDRLVAGQGIVLWMVKGRFDVKLKEFLDELGSYRAR